MAKYIRETKQDDGKPSEICKKTTLVDNRDNENTNNASASFTHCSIDDILKLIDDYCEYKEQQLRKESYEYKDDKQLAKEVKAANAYMCKDTATYRPLAFLEHLQEGLASRGQLVHVQRFEQRDACYQSLHGEPLLSSTIEVCDQVMESHFCAIVSFFIIQPRRSMQWKYFTIRYRDCLLHQYDCHEPVLVLF